VQAAKRGVARFLDRLDRERALEAGKPPVPQAKSRLARLNRQPVRVQRLFGPFFTPDLRKAKIELGLPPDGNVFGGIVDDELEWQDAYDEHARALFRQYKPKPPTPPIVCCVPKGVQVTVGDLHPTAGLNPKPGLSTNWALDWVCAPGTPILCPERATVRKMSGRSPDDDTWDKYGVYGWSLHLITPAGYAYFFTHFGRRPAGQHVGQVLLPGAIIGYVGDQDFRPDHVHGGVSSPRSERDAKKRIGQVRDALKISAYV
jgi:hypothetical protein